jgi:signal transduction histidine kinase
LLLLAELRPAFEAGAAEVVEKFYDHLMTFEPLRQMLSADGVVQRLKKSQHDYLISLTDGKYDQSVVERRLAIGEVHEHIGLAPQWFLGAYCVLVDLLSPVVKKHFGKDTDKAARAIRGLAKIMNLDAQVVLEAYFESRQRRAVERSERLAAVGELSASIAHEVRNPLAGMKGALQVLRKDIVLDASKKEIMDELLAQIARLENLVRDLLTFARPNPLSLQPVDLHSVLDRTLRLLQDGIEGSGITVRRTYGPNSDPIEADPLQMEQVFLNLIGNAMQAMSKGGVLDVTTRFTKDKVQLQFGDTGNGIAPADLPRIFQPFHTTKHRGSGLGLSIVKKIVEAHGGTVSVESKLGDGTTACVTLPRTEAP